MFMDGVFWRRDSVVKSDTMLGRAPDAVVIAAGTACTARKMM